jgi:hypothetical protein
MVIFATDHFQMYFNLGEKVPKTAPIMVIGINPCLEYLNELGAQLRITPEGSNNVAGIYRTDPNWIILDLNSGYTQNTPTITYQSFDHNTHRLRIKCEIQNGAFFVVDDKDAQPDLLKNVGFRGINGNNYVANILMDGSGTVTFNVSNGPA